MVMKRASDTVYANFWSYVDKTDGCWVWIGQRLSSRWPYGYLYDPVEHRMALAHRVAYRDYIGPVGSDQLVLHACDNPPCVRPEHLFLGTQADNLRDMMQKGRRSYLRGGAHVQSKISQEQASEIRRRRAAGERGTALALEYGLERRTVWRIVSGRSY